MYAVQIIIKHPDHRKDVVWYCNRGVKLYDVNGLEDFTTKSNPTTYLDPENAQRKLALVKDALKRVAFLHRKQGVDLNFEMKVTPYVG